MNQNNLQQEQKIFETDVCVIGAGFSGLYATYQLVNSGVNVILCESQLRVGGRVQTFQTKYDYVDIGAEFGFFIYIKNQQKIVGQSQNRMLQLINKFGLKIERIFDDQTKYSSVMSLFNKISHYKGKLIQYIHSLSNSNEGKVPNASIFTLLDLNTLLMKTYDLNQQMQKYKHNPWKMKQALKYDQISIESWLDKVAWTKEAKEIYHIAVRSILAAEAPEVSMLYWIWYLSNKGGVLNMISNEYDGAQGWKIIGGAVEIGEKLAQEINNKSNNQAIKLGYFAHKIKYNLQEDKNKKYNIEILAYNGNDEFITIFSQHVILAIPPSQYPKITFNPPLPYAKNILSQKMPMGNVIKFFLHYEKPYWREKNLNGIMIDSEGPASFAMDLTHEHNQSGVYVLAGFILGKQARLCSKLTQLQAFLFLIIIKQIFQRRQLVADQFARVFQCPELKSNHLDYTEKDWSRDPGVGGAYTGVLEPTVLTSLKEKIRESVGNFVHFAGTEMATNWAGYMEGALQAGEKCAYNVIQHLLKDSTRNIKIPPQFEEFAQPIILNETNNAPSFIEKYAPSPNTLVVTLSALISSFGYQYFQNYMKPLL